MVVVGDGLRGGHGPLTASTGPGADDFSGPLVLIICCNSLLFSCGSVVVIDFRSSRCILARGDSSLTDRH